MPGINGIKALKQMKETDENALQIMFLRNRPDFHDMWGSRDCGARDLIVAV